MRQGWQGLNPRRPAYVHPSYIRSRSACAHQRLNQRQKTERPRITSVTPSKPPPISPTVTLGLSSDKRHHHPIASQADPPPPTPHPSTLHRDWDWDYHPTAAPSPSNPLSFNPTVRQHLRRHQWSIRLHFSGSARHCPTLRASPSPAPVIHLYNTYFLPCRHLSESFHVAPSPDSQCRTNGATGVTIMSASPLGPSDGSSES